MSTFTIKVPASSANLGPGFDVIGLALSLWLKISVTISEPATPTELNCIITCEGHGSQELPLDPTENYITKTALYVLRCHDQHAFPLQTRIHIINDIPMGRGLGSSGAAVVGGVMLASAVGGLGLTKERMLDFCLAVERHPDNVAASLFGGFVGSYLNDIDLEAMNGKGVPHSEEQSTPAGGVDTSSKPHLPPHSTSQHMNLPWSPSIKAVVIIPDYEVPTAKARSILPELYPRTDVTFNMQRLALLTHALGQSPPNPTIIYEAMQDRLHQPYRHDLIPGLAQLCPLAPENTPGLLGVCLSGAGPTMLALATENFEEIALKVGDVLKGERDGRCEWMVLEVAEGGANLKYGGALSWLANISSWLNRALRSKL